MKILNVNASLDARSGGGTAERTFQMSRYLARAGMHCAVLTLETGLSKERINSLGPVKVVALPVLWLRFQLPFPAVREILKEVREADIIHIMGHWGPLNVIVYLLVRLLGKTYVVCPAGALGIFGRSKYLKILFNLFIGRNIIKNAAAHIAVTTGEYSDFAAYGISQKQITIIPNGVSAEDFTIITTSAVCETIKPYILFMGRLNIIKGPDLLLHAFVRVSKILPNLNLIFAGPDEGLRDSLELLVKTETLTSRVKFEGRVDGREKSLLYQNACLLVVPSRKEAMSVVALEAGISATPVMLTDQCGFSDLKKIDTRLEVTADVDGISQGILSLLKDKSELKQLGNTMKCFVETNYSWEIIVQRYIDLYKRLI